MKKLLLVLPLLLFGFYASAQISLGATAYVQDFNTLATSGTSSSLPNGWLISESGTAANTTYTSGTGSSNTGDTYSLGSSGSNERALGGLLSGSVTPSFGASFVNNTGKIITKLTIAYKGETWRVGATNRADKLMFSYSINATALNDGSWVDVTNLDYVNENSPTTGSGSMLQTKNISYTITGLNIPQNATFFIRFVDYNASGADDAMGIDDFSIVNPDASSNSPYIAGNAVSFGNQNINTTSAEKPVVLDYANLDGSDVNITTALPFSISKTANGTYSTSLTFTNAELTGSSTTIYSKFAPTTAGSKGANLVISGGGIGSNVNVALTGNGVDPNVMTFNFEDCTPANSTTLAGGFTQYSVTGVATWACTTFGHDASDATGKASVGNAIQVNGGGSTSSNENEDWLISPSFNVASMTYPLLSFWTRTAFAGNNLQLKISTNYSGSGNPNLATWTNIDGKFPLIQSDTWKQSKNIDLSAYKGSNFYIAFVYTSPTATPSAGARWTFDDFEITNAATAPAAEIELATTSLNFGYQQEGTTSSEKTFQFSVSNLTNDVTINAPTNFSVSKTSSGTYGSVLNYTVAEINNSTSTVYAKFSPSTVNSNYTQQLSIASTGVSNQTLNLAGNSYNKNSTLEVVNWNIEWFGSPAQTPSDDALQASNVSTIVNNLQADIYGFAEVVDTTLFRNTVLPTGYNVIFSEFGSYADDKNDADYGLSQKLAFMYRTDLIKPVRTFGVLRDTYYPALTNSGTGSPFKNWSSGRFPFAMEAKVLTNGAEETVYFI